MTLLRRYRLTLFAVACVLLMAGCEDFLQEKPEGHSTSVEVFSTKEGITEALYGVYNAGRSLYWRSEYVLPFGVTADDIALVPRTTSMLELQNYIFTPTNPEIARVWTANTRGISRANQLIEGATAFADKEFTDRIIAEAKFLRAWYYFSQVRVFGAVPLLTSYSNAPLFPKASDIPGIYSRIVADLRDAEAGLPGWKEIGVEKGRATRGAARSVLGKVYLTMATTPGIDDPKYFALAEAKLKEVVETEGYGLVEVYREAFWPANEGGVEDIFSYQFKANTPNFNGHLQSQFSPNPDTYNQRGLNRLSIVPKLYDMLEPADERRQAMIRGTYTIYKFDAQGVMVDSMQGQTPADQPYTQKFRDPYWGRFSYNNHDTNLPLIRYADVLLMYAEALNESNGSAEDVYNAIDQVRARSAASLLTRNMTKEQLRQAIRDERYLELHGEGHRWFDLVRWDILKESVEAVKPEANVQWPKHRFFPIPQTEIDVNPNLLQNAGYGTDN